MTLAERFWSKVNKDGPTQPHMPTPCWVWTAFRNEHGYGRLGVSGKTQSAHRVALQLEGAVIPPDRMVLHHCDHPACVRPDHLYIGTPADNMRDCISRGRRRHVILYGEEASRSKLTAADVAAIRKLYAENATHAELARQFNVDRSTIGMVLTGKSWSTLTTPPVDYSKRTRKRYGPGARVTGEAHGASKLTWVEVQEIRASDRPTKALAVQYGVGLSTIKDIRGGKTWKTRS
jgi:hypothetical protein